MSDQTADARAVVEAADAACHDSLRDVGPSLDVQIWEPVTQAVAQARSAHEEVREVGGARGLCPEDPAAAREAVVQYVTAVAEKVQAPFLEAMGRCAAADRARALFKDAAARSGERCAGLATDTQLRRNGEDALGEDASGLGRRVGRGVGRMLTGMGLASELRTVDVRAVAARHRALRLVGGGRRWENEVLRRWALWCTDVEAAWAAWVSSLLPLLAEEPATPDAPATDLWAAMTSAAAGLERSLAALQETCPHRAAIEGLLGEIPRWKELLASDLSVAGTFLLDPTVPKDVRPPPEEAEGWMRWQRESLARLEMHACLLGVYASVHRTRAELAGRLEGESLAVWQASADVCAAALVGLAEDLRSAPHANRATLDRVRSEAEAALAKAKGECPTRSALEALGRRAAGLAVGSIQSGLRTVPGTLEVHALPSTSRPLRRPAVTTQSLALQEMARQAFDALRMERIRTAPAALAETVEEMQLALSEVSEIVAFGFDAGATELAGEAEDGPERARELVVEGLGRAATAMRDVPRALADSIEAVDRVVTEEVLAGFGGLASRALAHRVQGKILDARSRLSGLVDALQRQAGPGVEREVQRLQVGWLRARRWINRLLRRGRSLVGAEGSTVTAAARTARVLAAADQMVESLPLVYQHLFAAEPVTDVALLTGRDVDLAEAEARWTQWSQGKGIPLLVTGRRGFGVSSFFNVFVGRLAETGRTAQHCSLEDRITDEEGLAVYLGGILGFAEARSLDQLAALVLGAPQGAIPDLIALEGLEHVYLRVPGGTDLLERLCTLMAETERRIFWMASLTSSAWQVVQKAEPAAAVQMDRLELSPLTATDLQAAVMQRHRRSGLRLHFEEPVEGRRLLRRRLRRLRGTARHQEVLAGDYFERLHRSAQGNLRLAFFQWLRSIDFAGSDGRLVVHPLVSLDWSFLDSLDLTQNFTIKAFLEHQTLTLAEHDAIFRSTRQESYHIFESLVNRQIIETLPDDATEEPQVSEVVDDLRYRIRPLLTGAVASHLASRNIVH